MSAAKSYVINIRNSVVSIFEGMAVTMSWMFRKPVTIQYPYHPSNPAVSIGGPDTLPERYRGFLEVDMNICTACQACARACPIDCIAIDIDKVVMPGDPQGQPVRAMTRFDIDLGKCMYCGLCSEPCVSGAIRHTQHFEASVAHVANLVARFVEPGKPVLPHKVKKDEPIVTAPRGSIIKRILVDKRWDEPAPELPDLPRTKPAAEEPAPVSP